MSGIAGIINTPDEAIAPGIVETMTAAMAYRGPDGIRHWRGGHVALGHCALITTPQARSERQPYIHLASGCVAVLAGRLSDRPRLLARLGRATTDDATIPDVELLLQAYLDLRDDWIGAIDGDFAFAIWDPRWNRLLLGRDRVGVLPLKYARSGTRIAFASDVSALMRTPWVTRTLDLGVAAEMVSDRWQVGEDTLWRDIKTVAPGTILTLEAERVESRRYWPVRAAMPRIAPNAEREFERAYRDQLESSLTDACTATTPVAFTVSGGMDSSALICLASKLQAAGRITSELRAYTLDFSDTGDRGEVEYARLACQHAGVRLREFRPATSPSEQEFLAYMADTASLPPNPAMLAYRELHADVAASGSRVIVTGEGGDQLFGSAWSGRWEAWHDRRWADWMRLMAAGGDTVSERARVATRRLLVGTLPAPVARTLRRQRTRRRLALSGSAPWLSAEAMDALDARSQRHEQRAEFAWWPMRDEYHLTMMGISELLAARQGFEARHPYFDRRLIEISATMPHQLKVATDGLTRVLHRRALRDVFPESILRRTDKCGASSVVAQGLSHFTLLAAMKESRLVSSRGIEALRRALDPEARSVCPPNALHALFAIWSVEAAERVVAGTAFAD